ncbi:DUF397 domain-containing protein [Streptomyces sp. NPDC057910]|uniref:DUF397 domain-containing protein n=1 Tax=Streptomyces sp. NPDC057910 TaxID=3346278 RepID=UPI0036F02D9D
MTTAPSADHIQAADWFKSTYSAAQNECVEVTHLNTRIGLRDSKNVTAPHIDVASTAFGTFISALKNHTL